MVCQGTVSVPLRGVGCFFDDLLSIHAAGFPFPCGVWVVSTRARIKPLRFRFRPLAGCGLFHLAVRNGLDEQVFPSPCGVWVVSWTSGDHRIER